MSNYSVEAGFFSGTQTTEAYQFVVAPELPNERYKKRDASIRSFCITLHAGFEPTPEQTEEFESGVAQIAARTAIRFNCTGETVDEVVEQVVFSIKESVLTGAFVPVPDVPVASYIGKTARWAVWQQFDRIGVRNRHELHGDPEKWFSSSQRKYQHGLPRPTTEDDLIREQTIDELATTCANKLTAEQQEVLALLQQYSIEEVAQKLKLKPHGVVSRAYRARVILRKELPDIAKPLRKPRQKQNVEK